MTNNGTAIISFANSTLPATTDHLISTTSFPEYEEIFSGLTITCIYGGSHLFLMLLLALKIYLHKQKTGKEYSVWGYLTAMWKDRAIYGALLVHIYDTATDFGVLWEWYHLWQVEIEGRNIISLDMEQFFTTAIGFLIAYRVLLGLFGWFLATDTIKDKDIWYSHWCLALIGGFFVGFIPGALELLVFFAIWSDSQVEEENDGGPGGAQKMVQSSEGVLESLPEVIMQSVFYMRAYNDPYLRSRASGIYILVGVSIFASLLSIASKYVWVDEWMVDDPSKSCFINNDAYESCRKSHEDKFVSKIACYEYHISFGYIIRVIWRLSAVGARFVIFALIWVVLGGAFEIIFVPVMVVFWYLLLFCYVMRGPFINASHQARQLTGGEWYAMKYSIPNELWEGLLKCCDDGWDGCTECVKDICMIPVVFLGALIIGVVLQLGIAGITGGGVYALRVIENFLIMTVITIFAFYQFDCWRCADSKQRQAWSPINDDGNKRIFVWIVNGWISITVHLVTSLLMIQLIDKDYDYNLASAVLKDAKKEREEKVRMEREQREGQDFL